MLREALVVDGTAKTCKGVIAGLERGMRELDPDDVVLAIVEDIPTRLEVYAWVERKNHRIVEERRRGVGYLFYIAKGEITLRPPDGGAGPEPERAAAATGRPELRA